MGLNDSSVVISMNYSDLDLFELITMHGKSGASLICDADSQMVDVELED